MSNTELARRKSSSSNPATEIGAGAPEPALCEVGELVNGFKGGWCLVRPIPYCSLGFCYGDGYLCRHPEIERIIARTQARRLRRKAAKQKPNPSKH